MRKPVRWHSTDLFFQTTVINRSSIDSRRCACLEPVHLEPDCSELLRNLDRRRISCTPARNACIQSNENLPSQKRPCRQHNSRRFHRLFVCCSYAGNSVALHCQCRDSALTNIQKLSFLQQFPHSPSIQTPIALGSRGPYRGPLRSIQHSELDSRAIRRFAHHTTKRIDFPNYRALCNPADSRVARHLPHRFEIRRQQQHTSTTTGRCIRRFYACVAGANNYYVVIRHNEPRFWMRLMPSGSSARSLSGWVVCRASRCPFGRCVRPPR